MFFTLLLAICGLNILVWWKLRCAFLRMHPAWAAVILTCMLLLMLFPVWSRSLFPHGQSPRLLVLAAWTWLAWIFWMSCAIVAVMAWNFLGDLVCIVHGSPLLPQASPRLQIFLPLALTVLASLWGLWEAGAIRIHTLSIPCEALPPGRQAYRIALISDIHLGPAASFARTRKIVRMVNECQADLVLSAGDLIDGSTRREQELAQLFRELALPDGKKLAVTGNHDAYSGLAFSRQCHADAGFTLLENQSCTPEDWLFIYGENDPAVLRGTRDAAVPAVPPVPPPGSFSLLLKHRPVPLQSPAPSYHLQLSGHSHGGQIFPFNFLVRLQHPFAEGRLHKLPNGLSLYVTPGTGVWGLPFRMLARPEITLLSLVPPSATLPSSLEPPPAHP